MKITVIIPTMNRPESLFHTLGFLGGTDPKPDEVIIVDQTDRAEERELIWTRLEEFKRKLDILYFFQEEPSLTKARNTGIGKASGDILVFMDDDVEVDPDIFRNIQNAMGDGKVALVAGLDACSGEKGSSLFSYLAGRKSWRRRGTGHVAKSIMGRYPDPGLVTKPVKTEWAMGYFFAVRRALLQEWGIGWDEKLAGYAYAEDLDFSIAYCKRAEENGLRCILTPEVVVRHLVSREYRIEQKEHVYKYLMNREYIYYKHYRSEFSRFWMRWSDLLMLLQRLFGGNNGRMFWEAMSYVRANRGRIDRGDFGEWNAGGDS